MKRLKKLTSIAIYTWNRSMDERVPDAAGAAAYYSILSIFPLIILTITIGSFFIDTAEIRKEVFRAIEQFVPEASQQIIRENINQVLTYRTGVSVFGILFLLWGASGVFNTIQGNLSRAWPEDPLRNIWRGQLFSFLMVVAFFVLLILFQFMQAIIFFITGRLENLPVISVIIRYISRIALYVFTFLAFLALYKWVPRADIRWREAFWGAVVATIFSGLVTSGLGWYLDSGLNKYNLVYGSLGALIGFMFWLYIINIVVLAGGHLSAAIAHFSRDVSPHPESSK